MNTQTHTPTIDPKKVETFLGRVVTDFGAAFGVALGFLGDKLGLYKAMAFAGPLTSEEIAKRSGTVERYVREWLINQAAGGYVEYDKATGKYFLPDEQATALTDENSPFNVAGGFQLINALLKSDDRVKENFLTGKGMEWGEHNHNLFEGTERFFRPSYVGNLLSTWFPAVDGIVDRLKKGIHVADLGCGHGASTLILASEFRNSQFTGFDNHAPSIERANLLAKEKGLGKTVKFDVASAQNFTGTYDLITFFDCLHDMGDPVGALKHCREHLADDGVIIAIEPMGGRTTEENFNPVGRIYSGASVFVCTPNAVATGGYAVGTVASDDVLNDVAKAAGFTQFRRATETPFNRVFEIRK
ncbi:MAG: class I SAM-dependent methyltransferase [Candidatus Kapaibacterium sp.]